MSLYLNLSMLIAIHIKCEHTWRTREHSFKLSIHFLYFAAFVRDLNLWVYQKRRPVCAYSEWNNFGPFAIESEKAAFYVIVNWIQFLLMNHLFLTTVFVKLASIFDEMKKKTVYLSVFNFNIDFACRFVDTIYRKTFILSHSSFGCRPF